MSFHPRQMVVTDTGFSLLSDQRGGDLRKMSEEQNKGNEERDRPRGREKV